MPSTTPIFIFLLLPTFMIFYHGLLFVENKLQLSFSPAKYALILMSLLVFSVLHISTLVFICAYIMVIYILAIIISRHRGSIRARLVLNLGICFVLAVLIFYVSIPDELIASTHLYILSKLQHVRFLGVSFISFSAISYLVDVAAGEKSGTLADFMVYLLFFPKVFSGPIVLWKDFEIARGIKPQQDLNLFIAGIDRLLIGLAKKLIIADAFSDVLSHIDNQIDTGTAYVVLIFYGLQIYVDFSAYSDIAIGLARMCGYQLCENFRLPYQATSIADFWRRWHISLGAWFRTYVYIPLGGNRRGRRRTLINIAVVFLLTGIWHGMGWGYLLWGMMHGLGVILDRFHFMQKLPTAVRRMGTLLVVFVGWLFFYFNNLRDTLAFLPKLFGYYDASMVVATYRLYLPRKMLILTMLTLLCALFVREEWLQVAKQLISRSKPVYVLYHLGLLLLAILVAVFAVNQSYQPFIYFQY